MSEHIDLTEINASHSLLGYKGDVQNGTVPFFDDRYPGDAKILKALGGLTPRTAYLEPLLLIGKVFPDQFIEEVESSRQSDIPKSMTLDEAEGLFERWFLGDKGVTSKELLTPVDARRFVDLKDIWTLRAYTVNGVCPDGSYLYDPTYQKIPPIQRPAVFLKHAVQGFSSNGNDHMALRRNLGEVPNGITGFLKDGATARSNSSIMHDIQIVDAAADEHFPVEIVSRYATLNLFEGYYCREVLESESPASTILSATIDPLYTLTLSKTDTIDVYERELALTEGGEKHLYDFSCYAAEIVAIALACDNIIKKTGRAELLPDGFSCYQDLLMHAAISGNDALIESIRDFCAVNELDNTPFMLPYAWFAAQSQ